MRKATKNRVITAWTSFLTTSLIFGLLGAFLVGWQWWVFFVPAITFIEAIRASLQYMTGEHTRVCPNCHGKTPVTNKFCDKCGYDLRAVTYENYRKVETATEEEMREEPPKPSKSYCNICGGPLDGNEVYCPTCGAPLRE